MGSAQSSFSSNKKEDLDPALFNAAENGDLEQVKKLVLLDKVDINQIGKNGYTAFHAACLAGNIEIVRFFKEQGANVHIEGDSKILPIHLAALEGHFEVVKFLVEEADSDISVKDVNGWRPVFGAAAKGHLKVVEYMAGKTKIDVDDQDNIGWTILIGPITNGKLDTVKFFLDNYNFNVDIRDKSGATYLHWAVYSGYFEIAELLIKKGADINAMNNKGQKPGEFLKQGETLSHEFKELLTPKKEEKSTGPNNNVAKPNVSKDKPYTDVNALD